MADIGHSKRLRPGDITYGQISFQNIFAIFFTSIPENFISGYFTAFRNRLIAGGDLSVGYQWR